MAVRVTVATLHRHLRPIVRFSCMRAGREARRAFAVAATDHLRPLVAALRRVYLALTESDASRPVLGEEVAEAASAMARHVCELVDAMVRTRIVRGARLVVAGGGGR